ncbi:MAG: response regulator [Vicinamibacterales bacterium]
MSEAIGDGARASVPADGASRVNSELVSVSLSTTESHAHVTSGGEDTVSRVREDARRLAMGCLRLERLLTDGSKVDAGSSDPRDLLTAARDLRCACQHLLAILGDEIASGSPTSETRKRVLVVDDLLDATDMVAAILEEAGFEVVTATNGLEGLLAAHRSRPTVILMDLQMPVLDGIETTRLLKAASATRDIPVIAHTARPDSCQIPPGRLFAHVLPKPTVPDVLLALVQRFVRD